MSTETTFETSIEGARPPGMPASALRLEVTALGLTDGHVLLREISAQDVDDILPAFTDPELREAGNLPHFDRGQMLESLPHLPALAASGRLLPLAALDAQAAEIVGGGMLHHLDAERGIVELGYWLLPHARGRGFATRIARLLSGHAFALGIERVAAYVNVGNRDSERVLERAGFTREGIVRSLPKPDGRRVDKTLFSLLPGELCSGGVAYGAALHRARHSGASQPSAT